MSSYISAEVIAEDLGVTSKTVREWLKSGELVGIKVGNSWRVHRTDFERYIEGQRLDALLKKAVSKFPNEKWEHGQCLECNDYMVAPAGGSVHWVCSKDCKVNYDYKLSTILDPSSEEYAFGCATVVPFF